MKKLKELTDEMVELERLIVRLSELSDDEYLNIKINISNGYNSKELDSIEVCKDIDLFSNLIEYYQDRFDQIKNELTELINKG